MTHRKQLVDSESALLRFITCGSVDDGKSTLIGRLLYESHMILDDQLAALRNDSRRLGTQGGDIDLALLTDGLAAEREQGITIDVAYRYFATSRRKFIVADTPGHEQYTRNMATGASTADLAVILIDARLGVLPQSKRHSLIVGLLGVPRILLAINKMDLVGYDPAVFESIVADFQEFAEKQALGDFSAVPVSALKGDNITSASSNTPWYEGPSLLGHLEIAPTRSTSGGSAFRMPVQWVNRPNLDFRGFSGQVVAGSIHPGDRVRILPSGTTTTIERIVTMNSSGGDADLDEASVGSSVTLTFADEVDTSRGDVVAAAGNPCEVADQFRADLVWMHEDPMIPGRSYSLKVGTATTHATFGTPRYRIDVNTGNKLAADVLELNEIGSVNLSCGREIAYDPYDECREMGGFIVIDRLTQNTVGAGMIRYALRRSQNIHRQNMQIDRPARERLRGHRAAVVWLTGLSGAGKSTIADALEARLHQRGIGTYVLDGDNIRHGLNRDLGFTEVDRVENIRRVGEVAALMADAGLVVITAFISPFRADRDQLRERLGADFFEVYVQASLETVERRDPKGLYAKARAGELPNFTGIDSPYEVPESADIVIDTDRASVEDAVDALLTGLRERGVLG